MTDNFAISNMNTAMVKYIKVNTYICMHESSSDGDNYNININLCIHIHIYIYSWTLNCIASVRTPSYDDLSLSSS